MERLLIKNYETYSKVCEILKSFNDIDIDINITTVDENQTLITTPSEFVIDIVTDKLIDNGICQENWTWFGHEAKNTPTETKRCPGCNSDIPVNNIPDDFDSYGCTDCQEESLSVSEKNDGHFNTVYGY